MTATTYRPYISTAIPRDVDASLHSEIRATLAGLNAELSVFSASGPGAKDRMRERAAIALSTSNVSACGLADVVRAED